MASPYALDFGPIRHMAELWNQKDQFAQQQELAKNRLGMEQERLGFERAKHPFEIAALQEGIRHTGTMNPYAERTAKVGAESAEETLAATRSLRTDLGGGGAAATPSTAKMPTPAAAPLDRAAQAKRTAEFIEKHVLQAEKEFGPQVAETNWKTFQEHPDIAPRWQRQVQAYGSSGNWRQDAADLVRDARHEASGSVLKPWERSSAAEARLSPQQQSAAPAPAPAPAVAPAAADPSRQPLFNLADEFQKARRMIASGVPAFVQAGETHMKFVQSMMEKGGQLTQAGAVQPIPGAAETQARQAGLKQEAEKTGEAQAAAQSNLPTALNTAQSMIRNIDAVLNDPGLDSVVGVTAGHSWSPTIWQSSADTEARLKQIEGNVFMQAYQSLKGGGAITDIEGQKAAVSIARMNERRQSPAAYRAALREARSDIQDLMHLAAAKAQGQGAQEAMRIGALQQARAVVAENAASKASNADKAAALEAVKARLQQNGIDPSRL